MKMKLWLLSRNYIEDRKKINSQDDMKFKIKENISCFPWKFGKKWRIFKIFDRILFQTIIFQQLQYASNGASAEADIDKDFLLLEIRIFFKKIA